VGILSSYIIWSKATTFSLFVWSRIIGGLSKGNVSLSMAIVTDVYVPEKRGRGMVNNKCTFVFIQLLILINIIFIEKFIVIKI